MSQPGVDVGLYACRRANVAELNGLARTWMESAGRLSGPEVVCPGGNAYRAGDEVVTLAPGPGGSLVTSERAVIQAVHPATGSIDLRTSDGREVRLTGEEASTERLGYGYATTVHRSQGSTVTRAHLFADGEGRELAYVAMSRARESTHAWLVADNLDQAAEDLRRHWSTQRTPTWAIDTGLPDHDKLTADTVAGLADEQKVRIAAIAHAQTKITAKAINRIEPTDLAPALGDARAALHEAQQARADLDTGLGVYEHTDAGRAVADLVQARAALSAAKWRSEHGAHWRDRHAAAKQAPSWADREKDAQHYGTTHAGPEAARLDTEVARHRAAVEQLTVRMESQAAGFRLRLERAWNLQRTADQLGKGLDAHRDQLEGIHRTPAPRRAPSHTRQVCVPEPTPQHEPPSAAKLRPRLEP